jgi:hypothetical protein
MAPERPPCLVAKGILVLSLAASWLWLALFPYRVRFILSGLSGSLYSFSGSQEDLIIFSLIVEFIRRFPFPVLFHCHFYFTVIFIESRW